MQTLIIVAAILISLAVGIFIGMIIRKKIAESKIESAEQEAKRLVEELLKNEDVDTISDLSKSIKSKNNLDLYRLSNQKDKNKKIKCC